MMTWWDGVPCRARRVMVRVGDPGRRGLWYDELVGTVRPAVEVHVPAGVSPAALGRPGQVLFIDDAGGWGWRKVTDLRGHRGVVSGYFHRAELADVLDD